MSGFENSAGQFMSLVISSKYFPGLPEIELHMYLLKGQLISKCPYEKLVSSKIPTKKIPRFLP